MEKAVLKPILYITCPSCGNEGLDGLGSVSHLLNMKNTNITLGPWYCNTCGISYIGKVENGEVFIEKKGYKKKTLSLLKFKGKSNENEDVFIIVNSYDYDWTEKENSKQYFYEENQCPTNFLKDIEDLIVGNDDDPHGMFEYIKTIEYISNWEELSIIDKAKAFGFQSLDLTKLEHKHG